MEIKNSLSLPSPPPPPPPPPPRPPSLSPRSSRPRASHFKAPRRPLTQRSLNLNRARLHPASPGTGPENYPPLTHSSPIPAVPSSPMSPLSYAQIACPRGTKRQLSDRLCLSPVDTLAKRHTFSTNTPPGLSATPPSVETTSAVSLETELLLEDHFPSTPQETMEEAVMEGGTPETGLPVYNSIQRRRRLFEAEGSSEGAPPTR